MFLANFYSEAINYLLVVAERSVF